MGYMQHTMNGLYSYNIKEMACALLQHIQINQENFKKRRKPTPILSPLKNHC